MDCLVLSYMYLPWVKKITADINTLPCSRILLCTVPFEALLKTESTQCYFTNVQAFVIILMKRVFSSFSVTHCGVKPIPRGQGNAHVSSQQIGLLIFVMQHSKMMVAVNVLSAFHFQSVKSFLPQVWCEGHSSGFIPVLWLHSLSHRGFCTQYCRSGMVCYVAWKMYN